MKPRLLANDNCPRPSVQALRSAGYDVRFVAEESSGSPDEAVMAIPVREGCWILTFDRDCGELIFARRYAPPPCVVYFRLPSSRPETAASLLLPLLAEPQRLAGQFVVVEADGHRKRPLLSVV